MQQDTPPEIPPFEQAIINATNAIGDKDFAKAKEYLKPHEAQLREHPQASYLVGIMLLKEDKRDIGVDWLKRAVALDDSHIGALYALGYQMFHMRQFEFGVSCLQKVTRLKPRNVLAWVYLGHSYIESNRSARAVEAYLKVRMLDARFPRLDYYLANAYLFCGEREKAAEFIESAIELDMEDVSVIWKYVIIHNYDINDAWLRAFEVLFSSLQSEDKQYDDLAFALAGVYEKRGELEKACDFYEKANAQRAVNEPFDRPRRNQMMTSVREQVQDWGQRDFSEYGAQERGPIFIVGMPRSGTTLLQQMLGAHSQVTPAGELRFLKQIFYDIAPSLLKQPFPQLLNAITPEISQRFGKHYLSELRRFGDTPLLIDKMPSNFFYIPMIKMILPQAVVLHLTRDPIDNCWSMWRQGFEPGHSYSYDFQRLADHYADSLRQIEAYKALFPDFVHEVEYEQLTATPEAQAQRLLQLCGLEWEDGVLAHHTQKQAIRTASVNQANQPVYQTSKRSWEPVKHRIRPLIDALHGHGIETCVSKGEVTL